MIRNLCVEFHEKNAFDQMEWNPFEIENDAKSLKSSSPKDAPGSIISIMNSLPNELNAPFSSQFFAELVQRIKNSLSSIKNYTQISREKFGDR